MTRPPGTFRSDLLAIVRAAVDGASASRATSVAFDAAQFDPYISRPIHVIAVGKAAGAMAAALAVHPRTRATCLLAIGTHAVTDLPDAIEWREASHPVPDERSASAARRALEIANRVGSDQCLLLLLSGGASALMALPTDGLTLAEKQDAVDTMLRAGADIEALNTVRKHLSAVKGGRLAVACPGTTVTLAVSDVVGDDVSVIGSGPGVADPSTWADAAHAFERFAGGAGHTTVRRILGEGVRGLRPETPKPGDPALVRAHAFVIGSRRHATTAAAAAASHLGYRPIVMDGDIVGEARAAAARWFARARALGDAGRGPVCVLSAGETTVRVVGGGRGGRNQEFALALVDRVAADSREMMVASVGTDGIDGPTDAAGALVDRTSRSRAAAIGFAPQAFLDDNNAYEFFAPLGDLIHLGRTDTNVGDVQILLME